MINIKLNLEAGKATPTPPVGPILSQYGININKFCVEYNKKTSDYIGLYIPVSIYLLDNKNFKLKLHYPSTSYLIEKYAYKHILSFNSLKKILNLKKKELYPITYKNTLKIIIKILKQKKIKIILI